MVGIKSPPDVRFAGENLQNESSTLENRWSKSR
jgi:hypothetical protein